MQAINDTKLLRYRQEIAVAERNDEPGMDICAFCKPVTPNLHLGNSLCLFITEQK